MTITCRRARKNELDAMLALYPGLASFDVPEGRTADQLWAGDAEMLRAWANGKADCAVHVAVDNGDVVVGVAVVTLRMELISGEQSAHLEVLVVDRNARGQGVGKKLLSVAEADAKANGALSMTLHVFGSNTNARQVYKRLGYDEELIRAIKRF